MISILQISTLRLSETNAVNCPESSTQSWTQSCLSKLYLISIDNGSKEEFLYPYHE